MRIVTLNFQNGNIDIQDVPTPNLPTNGILVANYHSLISSGTEGYVINMAKKGPLGKAKDRPDLAKQVINKAIVEGFWNTYKVVRNLINSPLPLGYSSCGEVLETTTKADLFRVGDKVVCAGLGLANHAEHISIPVTMACKLPENVTTEEGAFGTLGAIALHGIRLAKPELGEVFVVIGLGLLGLLAVQILKANSCKVIGFDIDPSKVELGLTLGMDAGGVIGTDDPRELVISHTGGYGADGVLISAHSSSDQPIQMAGDLARERGRVIALGLVNLEIPRRTFFEKELELKISRAYGAGAYDRDYERKGLDYPFSYVRWTQGRNVAAFIDLVARGKVNVKALISHRFAIDQAKDAYALVLGQKKDHHIGILFEYAPALLKKTPKLQLREIGPTPADSSMNFGIIGAGRWAQAVLLPFLTAHKDVRISGIATAQGMSAHHVADKYGCAFCTTDYEDILSDPNIGSVLIATRHVDHAGIVCRAMKAGKNIFVEKPLAVNQLQLDEICAFREQHHGVLMVGFNRRFSPLCQALKKRLTKRRQPLSATFRFITPRIMKGNENDWVHDPDSGGSRIIGEVCHMIDTCSFLVDSPLQSLYACSISGDAPGVSNYDTLQCILTYRDGSIANLSYVANSDASIPQERIELFWEGKYALIDNFKQGVYSCNGKKKRYFSMNQKKGWKEEIAVFTECLRKKKTDPIPFQSLSETTKASFAIHRSIETGSPVSIS